MGKSTYLAHHTGEELDEAISLVKVHGLENLEHDKGVFASSGELPANSKEGDFAYVGTEYTAMAVYYYHNGWKANGDVVDLNQRTVIDVLDTADTTDYKDVF